MHMDIDRAEFCHSVAGRFNLIDLLLLGDDFSSGVYFHKTV